MILREAFKKNCDYSDIVPFSSYTHPPEGDRDKIMKSQHPSPPCSRDIKSKLNVQILIMGSFFGIWDLIRTIFFIINHDAEWILNIVWDGCPVNPVLGQSLDFNPNKQPQLHMNEMSNEPNNEKLEVKNKLGLSRATFVSWVYVFFHNDFVFDLCHSGGYILANKVRIPGGKVFTSSLMMWKDIRIFRFWSVFSWVAVCIWSGFF